MVKFVDKTRTGLGKNQEWPGSPFSSARKGCKTASDYSKPKSNALSGVVNSNAFGAKAAVDRGYCRGVEYPMGRGNQSVYRKDDSLPQNPENQHGPGYRNDTREKFLYGASPNGGEDGVSYSPGYRSPGPHASAPHRSVEEQSGHELRQNSLHRRSPPRGSNDNYGRGRR